MTRPITLTKAMTGYKFLIRNGVTALCRLTIPKGARARIQDGKCRAEFAYVKRIASGGRYLRWANSPILNNKAQPLSYIVGKRVVAHQFAENFFTCAAGIHFFRTLKEAVRYEREVLHPPRNSHIRTGITPLTKKLMWVRK